MLWSTDSCQYKVYPDQYHLTVSGAQVSTHRGQVHTVAFRSYPLMCKRAKKSQAILTLPDGFQELHLDW